MTVLRPLSSLMLPPVEQALTKFIKSKATIAYELPKKGGDKSDADSKDEL